MHPLGREIRICPGRRPGIGLATGLLVAAGMLSLLTVSVAGEDSTQGGDLVLLIVLILICAVPAALLLWRRAKVIARGLEYRVHELGVARHTAAAREELRFAEVSRIDHVLAGVPKIMLARAQGAPWAIDGGEVDDIEGLFPLLQALHAGQVPARVHARERLDRTWAATVDFEPVESHPIPIIGTGKLELGREGARFQGAAARNVLPTIAGVTTGLLGLIATAVVFSGLDLDFGRQTGKLAAVIAIVVGVFPGLMVYDVVKKRIKGGLIDLVVPWSAVRILSITGPRAAIRLTSPGFRGVLTLVARDPESANALAALMPMVE